MRMAMIARCATAAMAASTASAQELYRVRPTSLLTERFCLPPCLCPYHEFSGPTTGTFELTFVGQDPWFRYYDVAVVDWLSLINGEAVRATGAGTYRIGGDFALVHEMKLALVVGPDPVATYDSGLVPLTPGFMFPRIAISMTGEPGICRENEFRIVAEPETCYADCTGEGQLTVADFGCFQLRFVLGTAYADCNQDGQLSVADFGCFQTAFAVGCP